MDFYFVKIKFKSKATAEDGIGYFFGKSARPPEFDFVVVPARYSNMINISLDLEYKDFMEEFKRVKKKVLNNVDEAVDLTDDFLNYLRFQIQKKGPDVFSTEIAAAVENDDGELLHFTFTELIKGWTPRIDVTIVYKPMSMEEISMENFLSQMEDLGDENLLEVLTRPDIKDLPEVFPIIDPIHGKTISEFDIGDNIFVVVLNPGSEQYKKMLESSFPSHFQNGENVKPLMGTLVSKELIVGKKGGRYFLIKVDFGKGIIGKGIISRSLKIMGDIQRFEKKFAPSSNEDELFAKVGEAAKEVFQKNREAIPRAPTVKRQRRVKSSVYVHTSGIDFGIAFLATVLIVGLILIISYFFL